MGLGGVGGLATGVWVCYAAKRSVVTNKIISERAPRLVAIVGGSGSGKSWLAQRLQRMLGRVATRLALDDFYLDRSHLPPLRRERINFDHPRAIDWSCVEQVLKECRAGRTARLPQYDFATHTRRLKRQRWRPGRLVFMEGLWLLRRPAIRRLFDCRIYIDCPASLRLRRRQQRDLVERNRSRASVWWQFHRFVSPMHARFVAPQQRWAEVVLKQPISPAGIKQLAERLRSLLTSKR